jgi:hypothetical protein
MLALQAKWEKDVPDPDSSLHLYAFDLPAQKLHELFGYPADGPDLVLSTKDR